MGDVWSVIQEYNLLIIRQQVITGAMPIGSTLTEEQIELISCWVDNGTLDN